MSVKIASPTYDLARHFMAANIALRNHLATHSVISYPSGLRPNQLKVLHLVFHKPGMSQKSAAERLGISTASLSNSIRLMEVQGLIERRADPNDARVMLLYLAPIGEQVFEQAFDSFIDTCADLLEALPSDDQQALVEQLEGVLTANNVNLDSGKLNYANKLRTI